MNLKKLRELANASYSTGILNSDLHRLLDLVELQHEALLYAINNMLPECQYEPNLSDKALSSYDKLNQVEDV